MSMTVWFFVFHLPNSSLSVVCSLPDGLEEKGKRRKNYKKRDLSEADGAEGNVKNKKKKGRREQQALNITEPALSYNLYLLPSSHSSCT